MRTGLIAFHTGPNSSESGTSPTHHQHVEHAEDRVGQQVLAEHGRDGGVARTATSPTHAQRHAGTPVESTSAREPRPAPAGRWSRRRTAGVRQASARTREGDDQRRDRAGDRQLGRDRQVLGAADAVREARSAVGGSPSADLELDDGLVERVRLDVDDAGLVDRLSSSVVVPASYSSSCSGEECTWISPGASAVTSSSIGWPTCDLDPVAVRGDRVAREGDVDGLRRRARSESAVAGVVAAARRPAAAGDEAQAGAAAAVARARRMR